jgi:hypothetical protein
MQQRSPLRVNGEIYMSKKAVVQESSISDRLLEHRWLKDRIFDGDVFQGTYVVYGATPVGVTPFACDGVQSLEESDVTELRGYRERRRRAGKKVPALRRDALHDEMLVIFGPGLSPKYAIDALQALIDKIKSEGLLIGRTEPHGDFLVERLDGTITEG